MLKVQGLPRSREQDRYTHTEMPRPAGAHHHNGQLKASGRTEADVGPGVANFQINPLYLGLHDPYHVLYHLDDPGWRLPDLCLDFVQRVLKQLLRWYQRTKARLELSELWLQVERGEAAIPD